MSVHVGPEPPDQPSGRAFRGESCIWVALGIGIGAETRFTGRIAKITLEVGPAM